MIKEYGLNEFCMKKGYTRKVLFLIMKGKFVGYWKTIVILISNVSNDVTNLVSRLFDVVKLISLLAFGFIAVSVMLFLSPVILPFYLLISTLFRFDKFKKYHKEGILPEIRERKGHKKYCIEKGVIVEYFIYKSRRLRRAVIADANPLLGNVDHNKIPKDHVRYLLARLNLSKPSLKQFIDGPLGEPYGKGI